MRRVGVTTVPAALLIALLVAFAPRSAARASTDVSARWHAVASGRAVPSFSAVSALSSHDVWAVGRTGSERGTPIAAHWNGRTLRIHKPFPRATGELTDVAAVSADDVWAVGDLGETAVVLRWNGRAWRRFAVPRLGGTRLVAIAAATSNDVWIAANRRLRVTVHGPDDSESISRPFILHWDGKLWEAEDLSGLVAPCPWQQGTGRDWQWSCGTYLEDVHVAAAGDIWTLGTQTAIDFGGYAPIVLRSAGAGWRSLAVPSTPAGMRAVDLTATPRLVWTVEQYTEETTHWRFRLTRWEAGTPRPFEQKISGASVSAIAATSDTNVWFVGTRWNAAGSKPLGPLVVRWNGTRAVRQLTKLDSLVGTTLESVDAVSPTDVWAAGAHLLARYSP